MAIADTGTIAALATIATNGQIVNWRQLATKREVLRVAGKEENSQQEASKMEGVGPGATRNTRIYLSIYHGIAVLSIGARFF